jgi:hypothetical protein
MVNCDKYQVFVCVDTSIFLGATATGPILVDWVNQLPPAPAAELSSVCDGPLEPVPTSSLHAVVRKTLHKSIKPMKQSGKLRGSASHAIGDDRRSEAVQPEYVYDDYYSKNYYDLAEAKTTVTSVSVSGDDSLDYCSDLLFPKSYVEGA